MFMPFEVIIVFLITCTFGGYELCRFLNRIRKGKCGCDKCGGK